MFGRTKPAKVEQPTVWGWTEEQLAWLEKNLSRDRPTVQLEVVGFRQLIAVDGEKYRSKVSGLRADHEMYEKHALLFDEVPGNENLLRLSQHENELLAAMRFPAVRAEGGFSVTNNTEKVKGGIVGWVTFSARGTKDEGYKPQVDFHFEVLDAREESAIQRLLATALNGKGKTWLVLVLSKVDDVSDCLTGLRQEGSSSHVDVLTAYVSSEAGIPREPYLW